MLSDDGGGQPLQLSRAAGMPVSEAFNRLFVLSAAFTLLESYHGILLSLFFKISFAYPVISSGKPSPVSAFSVYCYD